MKEHFIEALDPRILPPPDNRTFAQRMIAANREWDDVRAALQSYRSSHGVISGANLFLSLSRFIHEMIPDHALRDRLIQHIESHIKDEFPPPAGKLF